MTDTADNRVGHCEQGIEHLHKKVDAVIDHTASQFGKIEDSILTVQKRMSELEALSYEPPQEPKGDLYKALAAAQLEIENADQNVTNEFLKTKYADLASVLNAVRKPLASNGLALIQLTEDPGQGVLGIRTILAHESGQTVEDLITMAPPKLDPQGVGSCRTYMRRYAILAICAIAGANDDDAEAAQGGPEDYPKISIDEAEKIIYTADELFGERADQAVGKMLRRIFNGINSVSEIREGEADVAISSLKNARKLMDKADEKAAAAEAAAAKQAKAEKK